ncbi:MAG: protein-methionine-sulfoxide reductase catalytic subunit MsrP [Acidobacteriota bacterium]
MASLRRRRPWDVIPEAQVTSESCYRNRRTVLKDLGRGGLGLAGLLTLGAGQAKEVPQGPYGQVPEFWTKRWSTLFPAKRNESFQRPRGLTDERLFAGYNNFYEFSLAKGRVKDLVGDFVTHPWEVEVLGEVGKKGKFDLDRLIRMGQLEERIYHFRCVEAWSANVPWTGYPLSQLIEKLEPTSKARFVRFTTVLRPEQMPNQQGDGHGYSWPYYEALSLPEAMNELTLLTFGMYGHPLNKQDGSPVRIVLPWKYGFKSIKSIVRMEFLEKKPGTFWSDSSREYGFYANVNPKFPHPRWSQASETFLNTRERVPTTIYNGYGQYVGQLYDENDRTYFY